jgi:hypothetical protein
MRKRLYPQRKWVMARETRLTLFQWVLDRTALGETRFGLRHSGHLRRSTFQPPLTRVANRLERRRDERLNC